MKLLLLLLCVVTFLKTNAQYKAIKTPPSSSSSSAATIPSSALSTSSPPIEGGVGGRSLPGIRATIAATNPSGASPTGATFKYEPIKSTVIGGRRNFGYSAIGGFLDNSLTPTKNRNPPRSNNKPSNPDNRPQQTSRRRYGNQRSNVNRTYSGYSQPRATQSNSYSRRPANQVYVSSGSNSKYTPPTTYYTKPVTKTNLNSGSNSRFTPSTTYYTKPITKTYVSSGSSSSSSSKPVYVKSVSTTVTKYRASSTESCSRSALSLLPSAGSSGHCTSSCYSILGRENAEKCCQSADSIEAYPVTCYPCKLCTF